MYRTTDNRQLNFHTSETYFDMITVTKAERDGIVTRATGSKAALEQGGQEQSSCENS